MYKYAGLNVDWFWEMKTFLGRIQASCCIHETINEQEQHVRKFLYKSLVSSACLWSRARLAINK